MIAIHSRGNYRYRKSDDRKLPRERNKRLKNKQFDEKQPWQHKYTFGH